MEKIQNAQTRGYAFEKYLYGLFKSFSLQPNASYRTDFDQIDGSFVFNNHTVLIEAKYRKNPIPKDDLISFSKKIESKSHYVRGLFITYSSVDDNAIEYFKDRGARFVVLTVSELFIMCQEEKYLIDLLESKFRLLDEKGSIYCTPVDNIV